MGRALQITPIIFALLAVSNANYKGPFLFWGLPRLETLESSALNGLDEEVLKDVYAADASAVIIFVKNSSHPMTSQNYPSLENMLAERKSAYMTQSVLIYDPVDLNTHTEVIVLSGTPEQEDIELCALFRDAEINFGENKVLGILANSVANQSHRKRRQANEMTTTTEMPMSTTPEPITDDHVYFLPGKALFYTSDPPELNYSDGRGYVLKKHLPMTVDYRVDYTLLILKYVTPDKEMIQLKFRIEMPDGGSWTLVNVTINHDGQITLPVLGTPPSAPMVPAYSYRCSGLLTFSNDNATLTMNNIQLQPKLNGDTKSPKFGPAIDCVGFMSTTILSGLFVSFICLIVLAISLTAILDIKTPNRFENSRSKQLTFTVQE